MVKVSRKYHIRRKGAGKGRVRKNPKKFATCVSGKCNLANSYSKETTKCAVCRKVLRVPRDDYQQAGFHYGGNYYFTHTYHKRHKNSMWEDKSSPDHHPSFCKKCAVKVKKSWDIGPCGCGG